MKSYDYLLPKQVQWALNQGIELIGSMGKRGRPADTWELDLNLFKPLRPNVNDWFRESRVQATIPEIQSIHNKIGLALVWDV